ncbi:hypothetical protein EMPG_13534 [Blastomyces silverae]|uniref:Uncharacterized protein n=1 Tax=Blastomyces silverae TaxID=2060906 RepID=A0A0H1BJG0_9EURO|nr:hypothetical protein EMPG_13534 [Blastomyces silverae]
MPRFDNRLGKAAFLHCIIVVDLLSFSTGLPINGPSDDLFSIEQLPSTIARVTTNELNSRESPLQTPGGEQGQTLPTQSKVILGAGFSLGLLIVLLSILTVVGIRKEWHHIVSEKVRAVKQKPHPEKYSLYVNKRQSSCERLFTRESSTASRSSLDSDHTLLYRPSYVSRTVDSYYHPIEVYQATVLQVPHHGIHTPPTAVSIRSIQCTRTRKSDHPAQASLTSDPSGAVTMPSDPRPTNSTVTPRIQDPDPDASLHLSPTITLPPPVKLQPLRGPWGDS